MRTAAIRTRNHIGINARSSGIVSHWVANTAKQAVYDGTMAKATGTRQEAVRI
jgi:hypothetical protein